jgi:DNA helicase HerA-like ATPase
LKLRLSEDYVIDTDDYRKEGLWIGILAASGAGKSNAAADIVEDVLDQKGQAVIIEPISEWHTLKARYNNVVTVGGEFQDLPLEPDFAKEYVHSSLESGINLVVNVSDLEEEADQRKFVSDFLWNLYRTEQKYRRVIFLTIEEADTWAPQSWDQSSKQSLARVSLIAKHGRKIGIFPIFITQRPADFHKSPLTQCNVILFGKLRK